MKAYVRPDRMVVVELDGTDRSFQELRILWDRADTSMSVERAEDGGIWLVWDETRNRLTGSKDFAGRPLTHCIGFFSSGSWQQPFFSAAEEMKMHLRGWEAASTEVCGCTDEVYGFNHCSGCEAHVGIVAECPFCGEVS